MYIKVRTGIREKMSCRGFRQIRVSLQHMKAAPVDKTDFDIFTGGGSGQSGSKYLVPRERFYREYATKKNPGGNPVDTSGVNPGGKPVVPPVVPLVDTSGDTSVQTAYEILNDTEDKDANGNKKNIKTLEKEITILKNLSDELEIKILEDQSDELEISTPRVSAQQKGENEETMQKIKNAIERKQQEIKQKPIAVSHCFV